MTLDVGYDFRDDTPSGRDPDSHSKMLREYHRALWSKPLPDGTELALRAGSAKPYLLHTAGGRDFVLTSDTMLNSHRRRLSRFYEQLAQHVRDEYHYVGHTIGGRMVFPGKRVLGRQTFNQRRGTHHRVKDRFDLSLECIRLHYAGVESPLSDTLAGDDAFFALFGDFSTYIQFFLLDDYVEPDGQVVLFCAHQGFDHDPLPGTLDDYRVYIETQIRLARARNRRIAEYVSQHLDVQAD